MSRETTQFHRKRTKTDKIINNRFDNDLLRCTNFLRLLPIRGILQLMHQSLAGLRWNVLVGSNPLLVEQCPQDSDLSPTGPARFGLASACTLRAPAALLTFELRLPAG